MKKEKLMLLISLLLIPTVVYASSGDNTISIGEAFLMEAFCSIHMSIFVLYPLAFIKEPENPKEKFKQYFIIRAGILIFFDFFIPNIISTLDFIAVFIGALAIFPKYLSKKSEKSINESVGTVNSSDNSTATNNRLCEKCGAIVHLTDKFCSNCGEAVEIKEEQVVQEVKKEIVKQSDFDSIYQNTEDKLIEEYIKKQFEQLNIKLDNDMISSEIFKRKIIFTVIFALLLFVSISSIFFHFPILTYIIEIIILLFLFNATRKYDLMKYLVKEVKSRPQEKISNIIMNFKNSLIDDNTKIIRIIFIVVAMSLPLIIFINPRIMYEKIDNGYGVRFYAFGLTNYKTAKIPESYNGKPVISLRGNTFSNMPFLEKVELPDSITEIRGQAFKNDKKLTTVNIPNNLEYLGGGAFYNCKSITNIELPDTLTYLGGESFYGALSLESIKLSQNLTEIRGNSFEYCTSLRSISIPDSVTRIGGHAFYGDTSLSEVILTENSKLSEIGSSAFRQCDSLFEITIPQNTYVNERAFKESPTAVKYFGGYNIYNNNF